MKSDPLAIRREARTISILLELHELLFFTRQCRTARRARADLPGCRHGPSRPVTSPTDSRSSHTLSGNAALGAHYIHRLLSFLTCQVGDFRGVLAHLWSKAERGIDRELLL